MTTQNLMLGDCLEWMKNLPDKHYYLAHCDPNWGIGADKPTTKPNEVKQKNGSILKVNAPFYEHKDWDSKPPQEEYFKELKRVSEHQIIWGVNFFDYHLKGGRIVWDKLNGESDQFDCELAYCSIRNRIDIVRYMWSGMFQGIKVSKLVSEANIQQGNKQLNQKRIHPTEKPIALYKWLLTNYAKPGQKIFDSHGGSFSHAIAAYDLGFDLDIIELDPDYFKAGKERYDSHVLKCEEIKQLGFARTELSKTNPTLF